MHRKKLNIVMLLCFLLSGMAGLIYEVVWAKYLYLILGSTTFAHTLVLATFMGGLAIGSFLFGNLADRSKNKLALYAWLEMSIAVFCVVTPLLFDSTRNIYLSVIKIIPIGSFGILAIKFVYTALIILFPTILMGGTLPVLSKFLINSMSTCGETVARLYYLNSFGAVIGTISAGFYLIYNFGLAFSVNIAALINMSVGFIALALSKRQKANDIFTGQTQTDSIAKDDFGSFSSLITNISLISIFLSGFTAMLYELVWIRLLSLVLGSSTYSFSLMLAAFISGITIGSWIISKRMPKSGFAFTMLGICELLIGLLLLISLPLYEKIPFLYASLAEILNRTEGTFILYSLIKFVVAFLIMLPPTIFLGMTLPLASKIASTKLEVIGRKIGSVFAVNTSGNILGALLTGFLIMPTAGLKHSMEIGIFVNLLIGLMIIFNEKSMRTSIKYSAACVCFALFSFNAIFAPDWNKAGFTAQLFRHADNLREYYSKFIESRMNSDILFYKDGSDATVCVAESQNTRVLFINGKADASTGSDMNAQILCAQIPLVLKPDAKDVLVVGLGSGITCGSALIHPIENLDLVEICETVVEANKYFQPYNYDPLHDKRLHLFIEDAKTFLQRIDKSYDVIISEPSNPWMSGIANLFSIEYFTDCKNRLNEGGIMLQWVQTYETTDEIFETIVRTFSSVFPDVSIWDTGQNDILLLGSNSKLTIDYPRSEAKFMDEGVNKNLKRINLNDFYTLLSLQMSDNTMVKNLSRLGRSLNSDYYPMLEYKAPMALFTHSSAFNAVREFDERRLPGYNGDLFITDYLSGAPGINNLTNLVSYMRNARSHNQSIVYWASEKLHEEYPNNEDSLLFYSLFNTASLDISAGYLRELVVNKGKVEYVSDYANIIHQKLSALTYFLNTDLYAASLNELIKLTELKNIDIPSLRILYYTIADIYYDNRDFKHALDYFSSALNTVDVTKIEANIADGEFAIRILSKIAMCYLQDMQFKMADYYASQIISLDSNNAAGLHILRLIRDIN